jgi:hypothetical protein
MFYLQGVFVSETPFQFRTQEIHCIRDREGEVTEGGQVGYVALLFACMYF